MSNRIPVTVEEREHGRFSMSNRIPVTVEEREQAWKNYRKYYPNDLSSDVFRDFYELLGSPYDFTPNAPFYTYPAEAAYKVRLLAGPYHYALLKAREAQTEA